MYTVACAYLSRDLFAGSCPWYLTPLPCDSYTFCVPCVSCISCARSMPARRNALLSTWALPVDGVSCSSSVLLDPASQRISGYYGPVYDNFALRDPSHATAVEVCPLVGLARGELGLCLARIGLYRTTWIACDDSR